MNIKYKNGKEIINATLDETGLFCAEDEGGCDCKNLEFRDCDPDEYEEIWDCLAHNVSLFAYSEHKKSFTKWFIQAHPACQVEAQRRLKDETKNNR